MNGEAMTAVLTEPPAEMTAVTVTDDTEADSQLADEQVPPTDILINPSDTQVTDEYNSTNDTVVTEQVSAETNITCVTDATLTQKFDNQSS